MPHRIEIPEISVVDLFDQAVRRTTRNICTIHKKHKLSYDQIREQADRLAVSLNELGIRKGERVGLLLPNTPQFVAAFLAILKAGAVVVAINTLYKAREITHQANDSQIRFLIAMEAYYDLVRSIQPDTSIERIILVDGKKKLQPGDVDFDELIRQGKGKPSVEVDLKPQDTAILQYSGGTTGRSKGVVGTHHNLVANVLQFRHWLVGIPPGEEVILVAIPLFHVYGMVLGMLLSFLNGAAMVLIEDPRDFSEILHSIKKYKVNIFPGVPTLYNAINNHPEVIAGKHDLSTIQACISGSAPLLRETKERFEALTGGRLMEGYGLSEAPTATHCNPMIGENVSGSIGLPLPNVDARIVSLEDGMTVLPVNASGELVVRGPQVMKGYHNLPLETREVLKNGWLYTGDIARMDEKGYFFILDRKKDLIKPGGFQVWPREVEEVIKLMPKVLEVSVAGVPDAYQGETVKAWILLKPGETATVEEIQQHCRDEMAPYKVPSQVEFRDTLPKTTVGKVLRRELLRQHLEALKTSIPPETDSS